VIQRELRAYPDALHTRPVTDRVDAVEEGHGLAAAVAAGAEREGAHVPALDAAADARAIYVHTQQLA